MSKSAKRNKKKRRKERRERNMPPEKLQEKIEFEKRIKDNFENYKAAQ